MTLRLLQGSNQNIMDPPPHISWYADHSERMRILKLDKNISITIFHSLNSIITWSCAFQTELYLLHTLFIHVCYFEVSFGIFFYFPNNCVSLLYNLTLRKLL